MKYAVEIGSGAMMYIPSFTKTGSRIQKWIGGDTHTNSMANANYNSELITVPEMQCFLDTKISYQILSLAISDKKRIDQPLLQGY
jgi:hypothetical protein